MFKERLSPTSIVFASAVLGGFLAVAIVGQLSPVEADSDKTVGRLDATFFAEGQPEGAIPDFIPAYDNAGVEVGFVSTRATFTAADGPIEVYERDLRTVVGHHYPDIGFVPLGDDPDGYRSRSAEFTRGPDGEWRQTGGAPVPPESFPQD